jgi:anti-sigma B factor antagonist
MADSRFCDAHPSAAKEAVSMEITHKPFNRVDLLAISGRLDAASAPQLKQQIDTLFEQGRCRLVLDLANLDYVASPGLRVLIEARKRARDRKLTDLEGGDVRIANLPPRIKEVFDLTGFTSLFEIYPDTVEAVGSF